MIVPINNGMAHCAGDVVHRVQTVLHVRMFVGRVRGTQRRTIEVDAIITACALARAANVRDCIASHLETNMVGVPCGSIVRHMDDTGVHDVPGVHLSNLVRLKDEGTGHRAISLGVVQLIKVA